MLDIKFVRENPEIVKENIRKKFQDHKLPLVDEALELDKLVRGDETVKWNGATYKVRCRVKKYNTFSSHLSAKGIIRYLKQHNTNQLVFHHGEKTAKANAVNITKEELTKIGKTTKVMASYKNLEIIL